MVTQPVMLNVPEPLYHHLKRRAEQTRRSVEEESLNLLAAALLPMSEQENGEEKRTPNQAMRHALVEIEWLQKGMHPQEDNNTLNYLRQARAGEMYGHDSDPESPVGRS